MHLTHRTAAWLAVGIALLICVAVETSAQGVQTGTIRGVVLDPQRMPLGNVTVTLTSRALQGRRTMTTPDDGSYMFALLPPGDYDITFETVQFEPARTTTVVPLGLTVEQRVTLETPGAAEQRPVVAETPAPIATPTIGAHFKHDEVDALATPRTLFGIAQLAPGLTTNTPNDGQVTIHGAFAFDNVFMLNGVDVNDNLFGSPKHVFVEDAIEETATLTSGISAEYGRFTGGVVSAITKSGGNDLSGSYRANLSNPRWATQTPFELCDPAVTAATCSRQGPRPDTLQTSHEGTLGGYVVRDRLWFFTSGRLATLSNSTRLPLTGTDNLETHRDLRGQIKLTGSLASNHVLAFDSFGGDTTIANRPPFAFTIDHNAVDDLTLRNNYQLASYRAVLSDEFLVEAQVSRRRFEVRDWGGVSTAVIDSPILALGGGSGGSRAHYNAKYFDAGDPEHRNNVQATGNFSYFLRAAPGGRHQIKAGYEFFRSHRKTGNSHSATGYVYEADYLADAGGTRPVLDTEGRFIPLWVPGESLIERWLPIRGALLNVDHNSVYLQDHWAITSRWSADLGLRHERVRSEATGRVVGVETNSLVPRLAVGYNVKGDGRHLVHATYGQYVGRYDEAQIGANTAVDNPDVLLGVYVGPVGQGRSFAAGFDPANYVTVAGRVPTRNMFFDDRLSTPLVKEFTASYGMNLMTGNGFAQAAYIRRAWSGFIEDYISISNGTTNVIRNGFDVGTFTNIEHRSTNDAVRKYEAFEFQARFKILPRWTVNGHYTVQLRNEGNYTGESTNAPGATGPIGDYPEIYSAERHYPNGRMFTYQQNKLRLWSIYDLRLGRLGVATLSGLIRADSGAVYSLAAVDQPLTATQLARLLDAGYPDQPPSQTVFFGERGSGNFKGHGVIDLGFGYHVPVFKTLRPWLEVEVYNAMNNRKQIAWDTTISPDPASPADALGLRTSSRPEATFERATSNRHFPVPFQGETGGRTFRIAAGVRF